MSAGSSDANGAAPATDPDDGGDAEPVTGDEAGHVAAEDGAPDDAAQDAPDGEGPAPDGADTAISVEDLVQDLERVTVERDQHLDTSRRIQAEFENYRKQVAKREIETRERAAESLVAELLPVLDACDGALASGATDVEPVRATLIEALTRQGLDRIDGADEPFDPAKHDAVLHEPGDDGPTVAEVMRAGYTWNGRVVRPAMVRVRGG